MTAGAGGTSPAGGTCDVTLGIGSTRAELLRDRRACGVAPVIEFAAVIQQIEVDPAATRMRLDIAVLDISRLAELIDQEVTVTVAPAKPDKSTLKTRTGERKRE